MKRRWFLIGVGVFLPLALILGGRLWTLRSVATPGLASPFLVDPSDIVFRAEKSQPRLSVGQRGEGWRDLSPEPLAPGFRPWGGPAVQKAQSVNPGTGGGGGGPTKPNLLTPSNNSSVSPGNSVNFSWAAVPGALFYFFEHTGPNLQFTNPNGASPDTRNGFGGQGGGLFLAGAQTSLPVRVANAAPLGAYQWRVIAIAGFPVESNLVGVFSDAFTINIGSSMSGGDTGEGGNR